MHYLKAAASAGGSEIDGTAVVGKEAVHGLCHIRDGEGSVVNQDGIFLVLVVTVRILNDALVFFRPLRALIDYSLYLSCSGFYTQTSF